MGDWDFLYEMNQRGYSEDEIALAAGLGFAPWEWEYISKDWIDAALSGVPAEAPSAVKTKEPFKSRSGFPFSVLEQTEIFHDLVECAERHFHNTGRYLQIWGELGEIYAEVKFGLRRHGSCEAGSDGKSCTESSGKGEVVCILTHSNPIGMVCPDRRAS